MPAILETLATAAVAYLAIGALFAVPFAFRFAGQLDPGARAGTLGFKLLLLPGALALWPALALRLAGRAPRNRNAHEGGAAGMAALRRRHLQTFAMLVATLPFAVPLALAAHRAERVNAALPPDPLGARARPDAADGAPAAMREVAALGGGRFLCAVVGDGVLLRQDAPDLPDVLAYWSAGDVASPTSSLPPDARLLGQLDGATRRFARPPGDGTVLFFSLAHGRIVGSWRPEGR